MDHTCVRVTREMLCGPIDITLDSPGFGFDDAKSAAYGKVSEFIKDPMLVSWFDGRTGSFAPDVPCCDQDSPGWLKYAYSRGADCAVVVNDMDYVFVYSRGE
jgi:hypothetical protein